MTSEAATASSRASRRDDPKARIVAAAEAAFVAHGFRLTTMDTVARGAQCSKKTVYKLFNSKEELFQELLTGSRRELECLPVDVVLPPEKALETFLFNLAMLVLQDSHIALMRIAVAEAGQCHEAVAGEPVITHLALDDYLAELGQAGGYDMPDPAEAARMLIGMALGAFHHEMLAGLQARVPEDALLRRIRNAVRIFLQGCRVRAA